MSSYTGTCMNCFQSCEMMPSQPRGPYCSDRCAAAHVEAHRKPQASTVCTWFDEATQWPCGQPAVETLFDDAACELHRDDPAWKERVATWTQPFPEDEDEDDGDLGVYAEHLADCDTIGCPGCDPGPIPERDLADDYATLERLALALGDADDALERTLAGLSGVVNLAGLMEEARQARIALRLFVAETNAS